jgi:hypothetical protein
MNFGVLYSHACRDTLSSEARSVLDAEIAGRAAYADLFSPGPREAACQAWAVKPASPLPPGPFTSDVPVLMLRGALDPFSATPDEINDASAGSPNAYLVEVPDTGNNALGPRECLVAVRNAWVDAPTAAPVDASCLSSIQPIDLGP